MLQTQKTKHIQQKNISNEEAKESKKVEKKNVVNERFMGNERQTSRFLFLYIFILSFCVLRVCVCVCRYHFPHAFFLLHATRVLLASFYGHILPFIRLLRRYGCIRITDQDARAFM